MQPEGGRAARLEPVPDGHASSSITYHSDGSVQSTADQAIVIARAGPCDELGGCIIVRVTDSILF
jgi:hypothetical protein